MIRIVKMMDKSRVIGASDPTINEKRFPLLPKELKRAMETLYKSENIAGGESSWKEPTANATNKRYVIIKRTSFQSHSRSMLFSLISNFPDISLTYKTLKRSI